MNLFSITVEVVLAYIVLAVWLAQIARSIARKNIPLTAALVVGALVLLVALPLPILYELLLLGWTALAARLLAPKLPVIPRVEAKLSLKHLLLVSLSAVFLVPLFWMLLTSVKEQSQLALFPPELIPTQQKHVQIDGRDLLLVTVTDNGQTAQAGVEKQYPDGTSTVRYVAQPSIVKTVPDMEIKEVRGFDPLWRNYPDALNFLPPASHYGLTNVQNTLVIAILSVIGTLLSSSIVAYSFARLRWPGRDIVFGLVLATMMLPDAVTMMPRFIIFQRLGWYDTLYPLWAPAFLGSAFNIFLLRQFFMGIPKELEDAAKIDGCSYFGTYWHVMLPMVKPALTSVALITFIASWRDFIGPLIYISSPEKMPVSYVLQLFNSAHGDQPGMLMAATTMVILPIALLFFFAQRYFIEGISLSGLGGR